jgi:hypothetical protein
MTTPPSAPSSQLTASQNRRQEWLDVYMRRVSPLLSILALVYLATFSIQAIWYYPDATWFQYMNMFGNAAVGPLRDRPGIPFLSESSEEALLPKNLVDTITVVVPQFRAIRALRAFTGSGFISKKTGLISGGGLTSALLAALIVVWVGSLMVLNAERSAANAEIKTAGDAVWWGFETSPPLATATSSRSPGMDDSLAVLVMLVGISVLGVVTASLSAVLVKRAHQGPDRVDEVLAELAQLKAMVAKLEAAQSGKSG